MKWKDKHAALLKSSTDLFKSFVNGVEFLRFFGKLRADVSTDEDTFQVHPLALDHHPHLLSWKQDKLTQVRTGKQKIQSKPVGKKKEKVFFFQMHQENNMTVIEVNLIYFNSLSL
jgi:hypothetical protein